jgi:hypothetical protein
MEGGQNNEPAVMIPLAPPAWARLKRATATIGTFDDAAFQLSAKRVDNKNNNVEDVNDNDNDNNNLQLSLFDVFGYPCIPLIGNYAETYEPNIPCVLLQAPYNPQSLPLSVREVCAVLNESGAPVCDVYIQIHGVVPLVECSHFTCASHSHLSVVLHTFFYHNVSLFGPGEVVLTKRIQIGLVRRHNNQQSHSNNK